MGPVDAVVITAVTLVSIGLLWFFFGPRRGPQLAERDEKAQRVTVVAGVGTARSASRQSPGCRSRSSSTVGSRVSAPAGWCSPTSAITRVLPAYERTTVELLPREEGEFGFSCAMNMVHGSLIVTAGSDVGAGSEVDEPEPVDALEAEAEQADQTRAEIQVLSRRVAVGALLTAPVLFAMMTHDVFGAEWVPGLLMNHWWQLVLVTPVMVYTGWPVHRTGWLALRHRAAEMNTLITLDDGRLRLQRGRHHD